MLRTATVWVCVGVCVYVTTVQLQPLQLPEGDICKQENGVMWTCTRPEKCPKAKEEYMKKGIIPTLCSKQAGIPIICCESEEKSPSNVSKSEQMCNKYASPVMDLGEGETITPLYAYPCTVGLESLSTSTNGKDALPMEFPHMALVGVGERDAITWVCGGTLISERFVLSAAHCTYTYRRPVRWVRLGDFDTRTTEDNELGSASSVEYEIVERMNHPEYVDTSTYNDIALYRLKEDVEFNNFVRPACLQTQHYLNDLQPTSTGWGKTDVIAKPSPTLQKIKLTVMTHQECTRFYPPVIASRLEDGIMEDLQICAVDLDYDQYNQGTCNGDSGGPLQVIMEKPHCMYSVIGVVTFGPTYCGDGALPGVFTRVSSYIPWIESIVWP